MKQPLFASILLAIMAAPAMADSYDELNAGILAWNENDWDATILRLDKAIAAGDLIPSLMRVAYLDRGVAHAAKKDADLAVADYTAALAITPDDPKALSLRAVAYVDSGKPEKAVEDLAVAHEKRPRDFWIDFQTGLLSWEIGHYDGAQDVFSRLAKGDLYHYAWLWQQIVGLKQGKPVAAPEGHRDNDDWPWPVMRVYLGKGTEAAALKAAAGEDDPKAVKGELCEANFYFGEWHLLHGETDQALPLLHKAKDDCPDYFVESRAAKFALDHLP